MPRQDCAKIDYSLGRPVLLSVGFLVLALKKKSWAWTNSCQKQFPTTTCFCWVLLPSLEYVCGQQTDRVQTPEMWIDFAQCPGLILLVLNSVLLLYGRRY